MRAAFIWGLSLAVCAPTVALAALPLQVERVAAPAQLIRGAKKTPLVPHKPIEAGDRVSVGRSGRAGFKLVPSGELLLGEDSELFVHSAQPGAGDAGAIVRLALVRGSLHLDSLARDGQPPQDMRLNVGTLRVRVLGAEVWAGVEPGQNETICLLQGVADISTDFGTEHLDTPGDCLRYGANNVRMRLKPENDGVLQRKLMRTAFAGERPLAAPPATVAVAQPAEAAPTPLAPVAAAAPSAPMAPAAAQPPPSAMPLAAAPAPEPPAPVVVQAPPAPSAIPVALTPMPASAGASTAPAPAPAAAPAPAGKGEWTVVVLSVRSIGSARDEVARLGGRGLPAELHPSGNMNRVTIGRFNSRDSARAYAAEILERESLKAWVTQLD